MADERIVLELDLETGKVISEFNQVERKAGTSGKKAGDNFSDGFKNSLSALATRATQVGAVIGAAFAGFATKGAFSAAKAIEGIETRFEVLLGSAGAAQKQVEQLVDFAATTPFQLEGLADASATLLAFGFQQKEINGLLRNLGDVAAGTNQPLKEYALVLGQIRAAGRLTGERLLQLQERGANIVPTLAKNLGKAQSEIRGLISAGKVGFTDVTNALESLTKQGGIFANATIKQSKTLGGLVSTLSDNFFALQVAIGKALGPAFKTIVASGISLFQRLTVSVKNNTSEIAAGFISVARAINNFVIAPAELVFNAFRVAQNTINTFVAGFVSGLGVIGRAAASLIEKFGGGGEFTEGLRTFADSSREVFEENKQALSESAENIFDGSVFGDTEQFISKLEENLQAASTAISETEIQGPNTSGVEGKFAEVNKKIVEQTKTTGKAIASAINQALVKSTSLGIQSLTKSLFLGADGFKNFGKQIFGILGDLSIKLGESLILTGIGIESLKGLSGAAAIAAGAGLVALGTILKSFSGEGGGAGGGVAAGGGAVVGGGVATDETITEQVEEREPTQSVVVNIEGSIYDSEETGSRIVNLINDNFEREGSVVTGLRSFA
jgi:tape measure domain-containing protein